MAQGSERELVEAFCKLALQSGYQVHVEVPCFSQNIDIVMKSPVGRIAIECKMADWRRALAQAKRHLLAFDYSYVCMPQRKITDAVVDEFQRTGVGLLLFYQGGVLPIRHIIPAVRSVEKIDAVGASVERTIEEECHAYGE